MAPDHVFVTRLYRYRSNFEFLEQELRGGLWASAPSKLNDPSEGQFVIDKLWWFDEHVEVDNFGVVSLSEDPTNELLWSYYANGHHGYCLRYDRGEGNVVGRAKPVLYSDAARVVKGRRSREFDREVLAREVLSAKSTAWSHEREWRLIHDVPDVLIEGAKVTAVVLGLRTREEDCKRIQQRADELGIKCGRIAVRPGTMGLDVKWIRKIEENPGSSEPEMLREGE